VLQRSVVWAILAGGIAFAVNFFAADADLLDELVLESRRCLAILLTSWQLILAFLLCLRIHQAWERRVEATTILHQAQAEWLTAACQLMNFCSKRAEAKDSVKMFRHILGVFVSRLFSCALSDASGPAALSFEWYRGEEFDKVGGAYRILRSTPFDCEMELMRLQRCILQHVEAEIVVAPPAVVSAIFQQISRGIVQVAPLRRKSGTRAPFFVRQFLTVSLKLHLVFFAAATGVIVESGAASAAVAFICVFMVSGLNYIALETENIFSNAFNALPMAAEMERMNRLLRAYIQEEDSAQMGDFLSANSVRRKTTEAGVRNVVTLKDGCADRNWSQARTADSEDFPRLSMLGTQPMHYDDNADDTYDDADGDDEEDDGQDGTIPLPGELAGERTWSERDVRAKTSSPMGKDGIQSSWPVGKDGSDRSPGGQSQYSDNNLQTKSGGARKGVVASRQSPIPPLPLNRSPKRPPSPPGPPAAGSLQANWLQGMYRARPKRVPRIHSAPPSRPETEGISGSPTQGRLARTQQREVKESLM